MDINDSDYYYKVTRLIGRIHKYYSTDHTKRKEQWIFFFFSIKLYNGILLEITLVYLTATSLGKGS